MHKKFIIKWMSCASCVVLNEKSLENLDWIKNFKINLATNTASVEFNEKKVSFSDIKNKIEQNWFSVEENTEVSGEDKQKQTKKMFNKFLFALIFSIPVFSMMFWEFMIGIGFLGVDLMMYIYLILSFVVVFVFWSHYHISALKSLKKIHFNMDSLVSLWTVSAFSYSAVAMFFGAHVYFEAAVAIITLINLWKYLEHKAKAKAWDSISKLLQLWVKKAFIIKDWENIEKDIDDIVVWDILLVRSWEKIALDWEVIIWSANVDESMLTWESVPVFKDIWDECFWWTINTDWSLQIKVTKTNKNSTLANIIKMVEDAQSSKAPIERIADKVSWIFVPIIIVISIVTFFVWYYFTWSIEASIVPAVATLVIACPCALWLATPAAIMVWTGRWAKSWILIKNASTLEKTSNIDVIIFDKTWTLTNWVPELTDIITVSSTKDNLLRYAVSLSHLSHHPLSKSISEYWKNISKLEILNFEEIKWKWVSWEIWWQTIKLWNKKLFWELEDKVVTQIEKLTLEWKTPIIIWNDDEIFWIIWLLDLAKDWVEETIKNLHDNKIETVMLTGDTKNTANFIAKSIWIDTVISEVMPEDKLDIIKKYQSENKKVAFVWDGINDAPALVQADLSIAMWTWSDVAIESSDIVLIKWDLDKVYSAIRLSKKTLLTIKQNLFWAFLYNSIWIPLAAFGLLNPIFASFAMAMSSVSVLSNSLRLKKFK